MKKFIAVLLAAFCISTFAQTNSHEAYVLRTALSVIDDRAGDSWAEGGDVDTLRFTKLTCDFNAGHCKLSYNLKLYNKPLLKSSCDLKGINRQSDLIDRTLSEINSNVIDQIDACMDAVTR